MSAKLYWLAQTTLAKALQLCPKWTCNNVQKCFATLSKKVLQKTQLIKRKNELSGEQIAKLEEMEKKTNDLMVKCAINILLENKRVARKILEEMNVDKQNELMSYPIYNLL